MIFRYICRFCFCFVSQSEFEKLIVAPFLCIIIKKKIWKENEKKLCLQQSQVRAKA